MPRSKQFSESLSGVPIKLASSLAISVTSSKLFSEPIFENESETTNRIQIRERRTKLYRLQDVTQFGHRDSIQAAIQGILGPKITECPEGAGTMEFILGPDRTGTVTHNADAKAAISAGNGGAPAQDNGQLRCGQSRRSSETDTVETGPFYTKQPIRTSTAVTVSQLGRLDGPPKVSTIFSAVITPLTKLELSKTHSANPIASKPPPHQSDPLLDAVKSVLSSQPFSSKKLLAETPSPVADVPDLVFSTTQLEDQELSNIVHSSKAERSVAVSAYRVSDQFPERYLECNKVLAEHFLLKTAPGEPLHLLATPKTLAQAFAKWNLSPEESHEFLRSAVAEAYTSAVLGKRLGLDVFKLVSDTVPCSIAFLALCVSTAFTMRAEEDASALKYYERLSQQLECTMLHHYPIGFKTETFRVLWELLNEWLQQNYNRPLAMPEQGSDRRIVLALPLAHVAMRQVDLDKLPAFFQWARCTPGTTLSSEELLEDLKRWHEIYNRLTRPASRALDDSRRATLGVQLQEALEEWDGSVADRQGRRSANIEIFMEFVRRQPKLSYLARRPMSFPTQWNDGQHELDSEGESWYEPLQLQVSDGRDLRSGMNWTTTADGKKFTLHRQAVRAIPLVPMDEFSGLISDRCLFKGIECAVLVHEDVLALTTSYLSAICGRRMSCVRIPNFPAEWYLFLAVKPSRAADVPPDIATLSVRTDLTIRMRGLRGLTTGSWLQGAGPQILIAGLDTGADVFIDGEVVGVSDSGLVQVGNKLISLGEHVLQVGDVSKRISIVEPELRIRFHENVPSAFPVTLPRGSWTILGAVPGEVDYPRWSTSKGTQFLCPFRPAWAINQLKRGTPSVVAILPLRVSAPERKRSKQYQNLDVATERWVDTIYRATIKRASILCLKNSSETGSAIATRWTSYVGVAKQLKRQRKGN